MPQDGEEEAEEYVEECQEQAEEYELQYEYQTEQDGKPVLISSDAVFEIFIIFIDEQQKIDQHCI